MKRLRLFFLIVAASLAPALPVTAQQPETFRSEMHRLDDPPKDLGRIISSFQYIGPGGMAPAASSEKAVYYSAGVNSLRCSLLLPNETWIGTDFGIKRLNLKTRIVQHYTCLDGLPYNRITAIATANGRIYCTAVRQDLSYDPYHVNVNPPLPETAALCRFDAAAGRWSVLTDEKLEYAAEPPASPRVRSKPVPQQFIAANKTTLCFVPGSGMPGKTVALLRSLTDENVERIAAPDLIRQPFAITTAQIDENSLWLGSEQGLLHLDLKARKWDMQLPDVSIHSSVRAEDGSLWVLAKKADPFVPAPGQIRNRTAYWMAIVLAPGKAPHSYALKRFVEQEDDIFGPYLDNISLADGKVWVTGDPRIMISYGNSDYLPDVLSLDPRTGDVADQASARSVRGDRYDAVPDTVLANSHNGYGLLTPTVMPGRFPGWVSRTDANEAKNLRRPDALSYNHDPETNKWLFRDVTGVGSNGMALIRQGVPEERYTPPPAQFTVHNEALFPVPIGDKVYFLSGANLVKLRVWDRKDGTIQALPAFEAEVEAMRLVREEPYSMRPGKDCLWIGTGNQIVRCALPSGKMDVWRYRQPKSGDFPRGCAILSIEGENAWVRGGANRLYTAKPEQPGELIPKPIPAFPGDLERDRDRMRLVALEDRIAWFEGEATQPPYARTMIGYNLVQQVWTKPLPGFVRPTEDRFRLAGFVIPTEGGLPVATWKQGAIRWFTARSTEASAYGFDTKSGQWTSLPPVPAEWKRLPHHLIAVDDQTAWLSNDESLYRLDRKQNLFTREALPFSLASFQDWGTAYRNGEICFGSPTSLWVYNTAAKQMDRMPGLRVDNDSMTYYVADVDANAVWLSVSVSQSYYVARFDRATHEWKYWSGDDGVPQGSYQGMVGDAHTCWLLSGRTLYHLNSKTGRWDNISRQVAPEKGTVLFRQIVREDDAVWLLSEAPRLYPLERLAVSDAPLYRYDFAAETLKPINPAPGKVLTPRYINVTDQSLFLAAEEGVYRLDRSSGRWEPVTPPALPEGFPPVSPWAAGEDGENVWIVGTNAAIRFRKNSIRK